MFSTAQSASAILCHTRYCLICSPHESLNNHLVISFVLSSRLDSITLQLANFLRLTQLFLHASTNNRSFNHLLSFAALRAYLPARSSLSTIYLNLSSPLYWGMTGWTLGTSLRRSRVGNWTTSAWVLSRSSERSAPTPTNWTFRPRRGSTRCNIPGSWNRPARTPSPGK